MLLTVVMITAMITAAALVGLGLSFIGHKLL